VWPKVVLILAHPAQNHNLVIERGSNKILQVGAVVVSERFAKAHAHSLYKALQPTCIRFHTLHAACAFAHQHFESGLARTESNHFLLFAPALRCRLAYLNNSCLKSYD